MEESLSGSKVKDTIGTQESVRTEKSKGHTEMTEAERSQGSRSQRIFRRLGHP